jgi:heat shock protein HspQ
MKNIKIIKIHHRDYGDYDMIDSLYDSTEWSSVTDEEYELISENLRELNTYDYYHILIEQLSHENVRLSISQIQEAIKLKMSKKIENEAKRKAKAEEAKKAAEKKRKEKELKTFEMLKKKFEEG